MSTLPFSDTQGCRSGRLPVPAGRGMLNEGFQPRDCIRGLQTRMLGPFQVSVGRDGLCCAGWEVQRVLVFTEGRLSISRNMSSLREISLWDSQAEEAAEVSAGRKSHLPP